MPRYAVKMDVTYTETVYVDDAESAEEAKQIAERTAGKSPATDSDFLQAKAYSAELES